MKPRASEDTEFYGDWAKAFVALEYLSNEDFFQDCMSELVALGYKIEEMVKNHILENDLPWPKLSEVTVAFKGHDHIFIETGQYYDGIRTESAYTGTYAGEVVVYPSGSNSHSGISYDQIAFWQEYGCSNANIPERPMWRVVFEEMQNTEEFKDLVSFEVLQEVILTGSRRKRG